MTRKHKLRCYYCGAPSTSSEHVPPKMMFRGFSCSCITVRSCEKHNTNKSGQDQVIVAAFLKTLKNTKARFPVHPDIEKAISSSERAIRETRKKAINKPLIKNPSPQVADFPDLVYTVPEIDIHHWVRQLTAAIVYSGTAFFDPTIDWDKSIVFSTDWVSAEKPGESQTIEDTIQKLQINQRLATELDKLNWVEGWSSSSNPYPQNIYRFCFSFNDFTEVVCKHQFYNSFTWYVGFLASEATRIALIAKTSLKPNT